MSNPEELFVAFTTDYLHITYIVKVTQYGVNVNGKLQSWLCMINQSQRWLGKNTNTGTRRQSTCRVNPQQCVVTNRIKQVINVYIDKGGLFNPFMDNLLKVLPPGVRSIQRSRCVANSHIGRVAFFALSDAGKQHIPIYICKVCMSSLCTF